MNYLIHRFAAGAALVCFLLLGAPAFAGQEPVTSTAEAANTQPAPPAVVQPGTPAGTSNDRLFNILPNFLTLENSANLPPLSSKEKFKVVARGTFDYVQYPWWGLLSGINHLENGYPSYGQGAKGYGKRLATYAADGTIENFMTGAVLLSVFHQDPRFFQSGKGSFLRRTGYAVSRIVVTRGDSGKNQFNVSEVLGSAMSSTISSYAYHPKEERHIGDIAGVWTTQMAYDALSSVLKEFWPDIRRKMNKKKAQP